VGDLDNDGSEEIVVVNIFEPPSRLKDFGGIALLVRALTASGRDAIGARISVTCGQEFRDRSLSDPYWPRESHDLVNK
jgi:hypothetical protein